MILVDRYNKCHGYDNPGALGNVEYPIIIIALNTWPGVVGPMDQIEIVNHSLYLKPFNSM